MNNCCHSLEPLDESVIEEISKSTGLDVILINRESLDDYKEPYRVKYLICRDRDNIREVIKLFKNLELLYVLSVGVDLLPFDELSKTDIVVCNAGGLNTDTMVQYVIGSIYAHRNRIWENYINQQNHVWKRYQKIDEIKDISLLIVGAGKIGKELARVATLNGMKCSGVKKHIEKVEYFENIFNIDELDKCLPMADYIVCTLPLTTATYHLFDYDKFKLFKKTSTFINISRGNLVVEGDLVRAIREGLLDTAILDVFEKEPLSKEAPIWDEERIFISPHSAGRMNNLILKSMRIFSESINKFLSGNKLDNMINLNERY